MVRPRRGREFWKKLVEEFEEAGAAERHERFAARHGVQCDTFRRWLYLLRAEKRGRRWSQKKAAGRLSMAWPLVEFQGARAADDRFELELRGGGRVRVPAAFEAEALRRLLAVLDGKPPQ